MSTVTLLFLGICALVAVAWLLTPVLVARAQRTLRPLPPIADRAGPDAPADGPRLSVVIPACNEGDTLGAALATLLAQDYPALEVVVVNDRSQDDTRAVLEAAAAEDPRVRPVHIDALPERWLGKVHALHQGAQRARGDFILFTDADVHFAPGALRRAVTAAESESLDFLAVLPAMPTEGFLHTATVAAFGAAFLLQLRASRVESGQSHVGVGAFNLVRRSVFERSEGFPFLRMEVADDVGLALVMRRQGARASIRSGIDLISVRWYENLPAMIRGLEKNLYGVFAHYHQGIFWSRYAASLLMLSLPFVGLLWPGLSGIGRAYFAIAIGAQMWGYRKLGRYAGLRPLPAAMGVLGGWVIMYTLLRGWWAYQRRGGICWRGTFYPHAWLRAGQRVRM